LSKRVAAAVRPLVLALAAGALLASCGQMGGGPTPTPTPAPTPTPSPTPSPQTVTLTLVPGGGRVCSSNNVGPVYRAGRDAACTPPAGDVSRAFVAFLRTPVPAGATVLNATLTATRTQFNTPYPPGQQLWVEATPWVGTGGGLDPSDFLAPVLAGTSPVAGPTTAGGTLLVDVRSLVQAYVNANSATVDLRLRFQIEAGLGPNDYETYGGWVLQVTYRP